MDEHPFIRFAEGPAVRRAWLTGAGKDVWEDIATVRDNDGDAAEEIDQWIETNEQVAADARAAGQLGRPPFSGGASAGRDAVPGHRAGTADPWA